MPQELKQQDAELVFALDIGTRSIIGVAGRVVDERLEVLAIEKEEHGRRAMLDGQIEDIGQVAKVARRVTERMAPSASLIRSQAPWLSSPPDRANWAS